MTKIPRAIESPLRLYYHPISTTSRPILMFAAEHELPLELRMIDLMAGEQQGPAFSAINPNQTVPLLEHGSFRLTESSAILKYLADLIDSPTYPKDAQKRAKVNEAMDWFQTQLSRELAYGLVYPQIFPHFRRSTSEAQTAALEWSLPRVQRLLSIFNESMLKADQPFVLGADVSLADYLGLGLFTVGEAAKLDYSAWPRITRWLQTMKSRPAYLQTHGAFLQAFGLAQRTANQQAVAA